MGAKEDLLKSLIAGVDVSSAKQPLLPAAAAVDPLNSPCCFLRPDEQLMLPLGLRNRLVLFLCLISRLELLLVLVSKLELLHLSGVQA